MSSQFEVTSYPFLKCIVQYFISSRVVGDRNTSVHLRKCLQVGEKKGQGRGIFFTSFWSLAYIQSVTLKKPKKRSQKVYIFLKNEKLLKN